MDLDNAQGSAVLGLTGDLAGMSMAATLFLPQINSTLYSAPLLLALA